MFLSHFPQFFQSRNFTLFDILISVWLPFPLNSEIIFLRIHIPTWDAIPLGIFPSIHHFSPFSHFLHFTPFFLHLSHMSNPWTFFLVQGHNWLELLSFSSSTNQHLISTWTIHKLEHTNFLLAFSQYLIFGVLSPLSQLFGIPLSSLCKTKPTLPFHWASSLILFNSKRFQAFFSNFNL